MAEVAVDARSASTTEKIKAALGFARVRMTPRTIVRLEPKSFELNQWEVASCCEKRLSAGLRGSRALVCSEHLIWMPTKRSCSTSTSSGRPSRKEKSMWRPSRTLAPVLPAKRQCIGNICFSQRCGPDCRPPSRSCTAERQKHERSNSAVFITETHQTMWSLLTNTIPHGRTVMYMVTPATEESKMTVGHFSKIFDRGRNGQLTDDL